MGNPRKQKLKIKKCLNCSISLVSFSLLLVTQKNVLDVARFPVAPSVHPSLGARLKCSLSAKLLPSVLLKTPPFSGPLEHCWSALPPDPGAPARGTTCVWFYTHFSVLVSLLSLTSPSWEEASLTTHPSAQPFNSVQHNTYCLARVGSQYDLIN